MERRHLAAVAIAAAVAFASGSAYAATGLKWHVLAHGPGGHAGNTPSAVLALTAKQAAADTASLPTGARSAATRVDFKHNVMLVVAGEFGCMDHRVAIRSITRSAKLLTVHLVLHKLAPGTMECQAIYPTYRLVTVVKSQLKAPYPTRATASFA